MTSLIEKPFAYKEHQLYCASCYESRFAARCTLCRNIFRAGQDDGDDDDGDGDDGDEDDDDDDDDDGDDDDDDGVDHVGNVYTSLFIELISVSPFFQQA